MRRYRDTSCPSERGRGSDSHGNSGGSMKWLDSRDLGEKIRWEFEMGGGEGEESVGDESRAFCVYLRHFLRQGILEEEEHFGGGGHPNLSWVCQV